MQQNKKIEEYLRDMVSRDVPFLADGTAVPPKDATFHRNSLVLPDRPFTDEEIEAVRNATNGAPR